MSTKITIGIKNIEVCKVKLMINSRQGWPIITSETGTCFFCAMHSSKQNKYLPKRSKNAEMTKEAHQKEASILYKPKRPVHSGKYGGKFIISRHELLEKSQYCKIA